MFPRSVFNLKKGVEKNTVQNYEFEIADEKVRSKKVRKNVQTFFHMNLVLVTKKSISD